MPPGDEGPPHTPPKGGSFLAAALFFAALLAAIGFWVAERVLGSDARLGVTIVTALIVGGFVALILVRPRKPESDGFTVEKQRIREISRSVAREFARSCLEMAGPAEVREAVRGR